MEARQVDIQQQLSSIQADKTTLTCLLEDERKKVEDLQFRFEEETITKSDIEVLN